MREDDKEMKNTIENLTKKVPYVIAAFSFFLLKTFCMMFWKRELKEYKELKFRKKFF
jgi:hypothetical protein